MGKLIHYILFNHLDYLYYLNDFFIQDDQKKTFTISYYNGDTLITTQTVVQGQSGNYIGETPTKEQDAQYTYTFSGWSESNDNTVDADVLTNITADKNVYACYMETLRTYTATFIRASVDGGGTLYTQTDIPVGTVPVYGGETPTTTKGSATDYPFKGWSPALAPIQEDTTYTAVFGLAGETIDDDWSTILANPNYTTDYSVGDTKAIDLGTEGMYLMEIVAFNQDDRADGSGKAGITWISKTLLNTYHKMNNTATTEGGWAGSEMRSYLKNTIKPLIPAEVRNGIVEVTKYSSTYENGAVVKDGQVTTDDVWIPGNKEIFNEKTYETLGSSYNAKFKTNATRIKNHKGTAEFWFLRSASDSKNFRSVHTSGSGATSNAGYIWGTVALGFCTN